MIDGIMLQTRNPYTLNHLLSSGLVFDDHINKDGVITKQVSDTEYHGLTVKVYPLPAGSAYSSNLIIVRGSLHLFNRSLTSGKKQNYDLFTLDECTHAVALLSDHLGLVPEYTEVHGLEYGYNVPVPISADKYASLFIAYRNRPFEKLKPSDGVKGDCFGCYLNEFEIKAYNKGATHGLDSNVLRIEKKITKMRNVFDDQISLSDVLSVDLWGKLRRDVESSLQDVILTDRVDLRLLTRPQRETYYKGSNPRIWAKLNRDQRKRLKKSFNDLIDDRGEYRTREYLNEKTNEIFAKMTGETATFSPC